MRTGVDLLPEPVELVVEVFRRRVDRAGDGESRRLANRGAQPIEALVEAGDDLDQADRVDIPHSRGARVIAHIGRIAGEGDDVAHPKRVGADQLRLEGHQVLVAAGEVDQGVDPDLLLDHDRQRQRAHPHPGHRAVADVDGVRASVLDQLGARQMFRRVETPRRVDLDADDKALVVEFLREWGAGELVGGGEVDRDGCCCRLLSRRGLACRLWLERIAHRRDVRRGGATAAADVGDPGLLRLAREVGEVVGRSEVEEAAFYAGGKPGVGLGGERSAGEGAHGLDDV